eukprot:TRINITY_DN67994_c0_g1_i1.p1 TRINITY_DN67994_c0_g1~~TRINITY_DN67994_c0_g1_i1.p1  ORF type:complete len:173 (+),score=19.97 TRINITY_DN67994_c0_g1_i1:32-520(+)
MAAEMARRLVHLQARGHLRTLPLLSSSAMTCRRQLAKVVFSDPEVAGLPRSPAFSRVAIANGFVYISGTGAGNDIGGPAKEGSATEETRLALQNVAQLLEAAGSDMDHVVSVTMLLTSKSDYDECNAEYVKHFRALPSRSTALWGVPTTAKVAFSCVALVKE